MSNDRIPDYLLAIAKARGLKLSRKDGLFTVRDSKTVRLTTENQSVLRNWLSSPSSVMVTKIPMVRS